MTADDTGEVGTNTFVNIGGRPSYTYSADWGWMCPEVSDQGWRYYCCVRAFIFDKPAKWTITITDETVAKLLHRSVRSVARARKDCYEAGLIVEVEYTKKSVPIPGQVEREVRTFRTLQVVHEPPPAYTGPVNCFTEKERIEEEHQAELEEARTARQQARRAAKKPPTTKRGKPATAPEATNLSSQSDQGQLELAENPDWTDLSAAMTDLSTRMTDLSVNTPPDQRKQPPQQVVKQGTTTNQPATPVDNSSAAGGVEEPGWLVGEPPAEEEPLPDTPGSRFLLGMPVKFVPSIRAVAELAPHVDALLTNGWTTTQLARRLTEGTQGVANPPGVVIHRLRGIPVPVAAGSESVMAGPTPLPPMCGECEGKPGDPVSGRVVWLDERREKSAPCPRCHPRMVMAHVAG